MRQYKRLPRKLKKRIGSSWRQYLDNKNTFMERDHHLDAIFNHDYDDARLIVQGIVSP